MEAAAGWGLAASWPGPLPERLGAEHERAGRRHWCPPARSRPRAAGAGRVGAGPGVKGHLGCAWPVGGGLGADCVVGVVAENRRGCRDADRLPWVTQVTDTCPYREPGEGRRPGAVFQFSAA